MRRQDKYPPKVIGWTMLSQEVLRFEFEFGGHKFDGLQHAIKL